jgi:hypothetical protein
MLKHVHIALAFTACLLAILVLSHLQPGLLSTGAHAEEVRVIHAYCGETVELTDHAAPNTSVTVSVSRTITVPVAVGRFSSSLDGIYVPKGSVMSLKAWPVTMLKANGIVHGSTFSSIREGDITGDVGTISLTGIPDGDYDITIYGTSIADEVSLTVMASQNITTDASGNYRANASSKGLSPGVYNITANGIHIADVYLEQGNRPIMIPSGSLSSTTGSGSGLFGLWSVTDIFLIISIIIFALVAFDAFRRHKKRQ